MAKNMFYDTSLSKVESIRKEIQNKLQSLHILLDERESDLIHRLDEVKGSIATALKEWNSSVKDAEYTITQANSGIRNNKWNSQLENEAKEDLKCLEKKKPTFEINFKLRDGIEDVISNLGEINMKQINKQTNTRPEIENVYISKSIFDIMLKGTLQCPILQKQVDDKSRISRLGFGGNINTGKGKIIQTVEIENVLMPTKLSRSLSCAEFNAAEYTKGHTIGPTCNNRAFDDSYISKDMIVKPLPKPNGIQKLIEITESIGITKPIELTESIEMKEKASGFVWHRGARNNPKRNANKHQFKKRPFSTSFAGKDSSLSCAMYKLTEIKIENYLAERVTVDLRRNKDKQVNGTLRCVVNKGDKLPIVGIELDTNDGDCDGCFGNIRFFKTKANKACFITADRVRIIISM